MLPLKTKEKNPEVSCSAFRIPGEESVSRGSTTQNELQQEELQTEAEERTQI
jgi:hypothetical protein